MIQTYSHENYRVHHASFSTLDELFEFVERSPNVYGQWASTALETPSEKWYLTRSWEDAQSLARTGWADGAAEARKLLTQFETRLGDRLVLPVFVYAEEPGYGFDVGRVLEGDPQHWLALDAQTVVADGVGQVIRVNVNCTGSSSVGAEAMIARGTAIACLVNLLELSGTYRVELVCRLISADNRENQIAIADLVVKRPDQELDLDRLTFFAAHPSALRRLGLAVYERIQPEGGSKYYGTPTDKVPMAGEITFPAMLGWGTDDWSNPELIPELIAEQLSAMGVVLQ